jgi:hypothetical protein
MEYGRIFNGKRKEAGQRFVGIQREKPAEAGNDPGKKEKR